jgi:hypothetical protein
MRENMNTPATESPGYQELEQYKPWSDEECSELLIKGSRLNCNDCRIQVKKWR